MKTSTTMILSALGVSLACAVLACGDGATTDGPPPVVAPAADAAPAPVLTDHADGGTTPRTDAATSTDASDGATPSEASAPVCDAGDLTSDPANCGTCGNVCQAGANSIAMCIAGACHTADVLVNGMPIEASALSATAFGLVWVMPSTTNSVMVLPSGTVASPTPLASAQGALHLAQWGERIFWNNMSGNSVWTGALNVGAGGSQPIAQNAYAGALAVDESYVYWSNEGTNEVVAAAFDGSGATSIVPASLFTASQLASDGTYVYLSIDQEKIARVLRTGGNLELVATIGGSDAVSSLIVDDTFVYWATPNDVWRCEKTGGTGQSIAPGQGYVSTVAQDSTTFSGGYLYWSDGQAGVIRKMPKSGFTQPTTLATNQAGPEALTVDDTYVYWGNTGGSGVEPYAILRTAK